MRKLFVVLLGVLFLSGCGGGGGGGGTGSGTTSPTVSGTASEGTLITGKVVKLKDANGKSAIDTVTNLTTGTFSFDVTGLTAPYLVTVTGTNGTYVSIAPTAGVTNINPITTTVIALAAANSNISNLYTNLTAPQMSSINNSYVAKAELLTRSLQFVLPTGKNASSYFTETITAGSQLDAIFDAYKFVISPATGITVITNNTNQTTVMTIPAATIVANTNQPLPSIKPPPIIALPKTGQTTSYAIGDDGYLQKGVAWPNPRFTDNGNGTVTDNLSGLAWSKDVNPSGGRTWQGALDYIKVLNTSKYMGFNDWRLPNFNELKSIIDLKQAYPALTANHPFINLPPTSNADAWNYFWSSTSDNSGTSALAVGLAVGNLYNNGYSKTNGSYFWPVRGVASAYSAVPRTGQTKCSDTNGVVISCAGTGQDGDIQSGVVLPVSRFIEIGDGTVLDSLTALFWTKDANAPGPSICLPATGKTWQGALDYVSCLNDNIYLGYNDWRLPNREELTSLANSTSLNFTNLQSNRYWTSTTYAPNTAFAWSAYISLNYSSQSDKTTNLYVWPVR